MIILDSHIFLSTVMENLGYYPFEVIKFDKLYKCSILVQIIKKKKKNVLPQVRGKAQSISTVHPILSSIRPA